MIFMHNETGFLYEFLVGSLENIGLYSHYSGQPAYAIGGFVLYGIGTPVEVKVSEIQDKFTFIGFL